MSSELLTEYDATLDTKRRFVIRGLPPYNRYHVKVYSSDKRSFTLKMEPQVLAKLDQLSVNTLHMMDKSMKNLSKGVAGKPVNLGDLKRFADTKE